MTRQSNQYFTYTNPNPRNLKSTGDCVIRAISLALEQDWLTTFTDLCAVGAKLSRMPNDPKAYTTYLESKGWYKQSQPRKSDNTKFTLREFLKYRKGKAIVHCGSHHIVCIDGGKALDTWDCSEGCVGVYYIKG